MDIRLTLDSVLLTDIAVEVRNLSAVGLQLETRLHLPIGTIGLLDLEFAGRRRVEWFRVCRVQAVHGGSGAYLVGAEFLPLAATDARSLRGSVRRLVTFQRDAQNF